MSLSPKLLQQTSRSDLSSSIISWYSNTKRQPLITQVEVPRQLDSQDLDTYFSQSNPTFQEKRAESFAGSFFANKKNERHTVDCSEIQLTSWGW